MNAEELITEVIDIVLDGENGVYSDRTYILSFLNQAQRDIAAKLYLPDLNDGFGLVDTVVDEYRVSLPSTYHRGLYLAQLDGVPLDIYEDIKSMSLSTEGITTEVGDVSGVAINNSFLVYQNVPEIITSLELFFYRKPVDMRDLTTSFPDGAVNNDDYDEALINLCCRKIYSRIEDGMEGQKLNTINHNDLFRQAMGSLDIYARRVGGSFPKRPALNIPWPGVS